MSLRDRFIQSDSKASTFTGTFTGALVACAITGGSVYAQPDQSTAESDPADEAPVVLQQNPDAQTQDAQYPDDPDSGDRPASAGRVVRAFDFEEREYNPLPIPLGWLRAQEDPDVPRIRPGFPIWNGATIEYNAPAYSGIGTARLPTAGGSTSLTLRHGEINIFPNADYLVSARVRTDGLEHAKAHVLARLLNEHGVAIEGAVSTTPLVNTKGAWQQVSLEVEGVYPDAAFIQIELELLQPEQQGLDRGMDKFAVWEQDYSGDAYFDNLIIAQLPRLDITTGLPGNIVESNEPPPLHMLVRDLTGDAIVARVRIFDVFGREVAAEVLADHDRRLRTDWTPDLPGFGWYRAVLDISVDQQLVGIRTLDFIWSSPSESNINSGMFSIFAELTNPIIAESAPALIKGSGVTRASIEAWDINTQSESLVDGSALMNTIDDLVNAQIDLSMVFSQLPRELATTLAVDPDEVMPVFAGPSSAWVPWAGSMLDEYGQAVAHWRFGDQPTLESPDTLNAELDNINTALRGYVPGPMIVTPWAIDRPIEPTLTRPNRQLLLIDHGDTSEAVMPLVVEEWFASARSQTQAKPDQLPSLGMVLSPSHEIRTWSSVEIWSSVGGLARKAISFWWAASLTGLDNERFDLELRDAWWVSKGKRGQVMPAPEVVVWKTLATHLGGRSAIEQIDLVPGVHMLVAGPQQIRANAQTSQDGRLFESGSDDRQAGEDESGIMILWLDEPSLDPVVLNLPVAMGPVSSFDVFNNETIIELERVGGLSLPVHRIEIGRSPIIIKGVNTQLVRFLSSIKLTPDRLQAKSGIHHHSVTLSNPWPITIRGQLYIVEPGGYTDPDGNIDRSWEIKPRVLPFVLNPNEQSELPIELAYSLGELAGEKKLSFDVELQADQDYPLMRLERTIELGYDGIEMFATARKAQDGIVIVSVYVTNLLDVVQDFELIAIPPNESRLRRSINGIAPGEQAIREFAFTKADSGDQIIVALLLRDSSIRLNQSVSVP